VRQSLQQISRSSVRATHTVNQLLALARAENTGQALELLPLELGGLVADAVRQSLPRALDKGQDMGYDPPPADAPVWVRGQRTLLQELVRNLLDNAIAYCPRAAVITARVRQTDEAVLLQVEDNGPGIAAEQREAVFEPFVRILGTDADGSGLGLSIVREIAQRHRATVRLEAPSGSAGVATAGALVTVTFEPVGDAEGASGSKSSVVGDKP
jgi:two-component system, OmpR family, sensor histidine kinase TctE